MDKLAKDFLNRLGEDPALFGAFRADPRLIARSAGLAEDDIETLVVGGFSECERRLLAEDASIGCIVSLVSAPSFA